MFTFLNWENHSPPPSSNQGWMVSSFGFRYASPLIWGDGDLIFHFILSKIVALIGKNPAFKLQGALYFFCDPLTYRAAVWIFQSSFLEILSLFSFEDYLFCANHALLTWISSHLYLFSDFQGRIQEFLIGGRGGGGSKLWFRKDCWTFLCQITSHRDDH